MPVGGELSRRGGVTVAVSNTERPTVNRPRSPGRVVAASKTAVAVAVVPALTLNGSHALVEPAIVGVTAE